MSELQLALIIFGIVLVIAVLVFNWIQENKYKNKKTLESNITDDPLFKDHRRETDSSVDDKEMELSSASFEAADEKQSLGEERVAETAETIPTLSFVESDDLYHKTEFLVELSITESYDFNEISDFTAQILTENPGISLYLFDEINDQWIEAKNINNSPGKYRIGLPLINKSGRLEYEPLVEYVRKMELVTAKIAVSGIMSPIEKSLHEAVDLQEFVGEVGSIVGINIIANSGHLFSGVRIKALADSYGLEMRSQGGFVYLSAGKRVMFSMDSYGGEPITSENIRTLMIPGITFLIDVPVVENGLEVLDKVKRIVIDFSEHLNGDIVDDNRRIIDDDAFKKIRSNISVIYEKMQLRGIPAGSQAARRIFY
ncbi:MAG: hypothetical protein CMK56_03825 [Proteobacteria bacterium]|nr:hypothetical protein [Pseudomonadota bacterium]